MNKDKFHKKLKYGDNYCEIHDVMANAKQIELAQALGPIHRAQTHFCGECFGELGVRTKADYLPRT